MKRPQLVALAAVSLAVSASACGKTEMPGAPISCATAATPDVSANGPFDVDTGLSPSTVGASYGQPSCSQRFLVEVDLTQPAFQGHDLFVSGEWTSALPAQPCDRGATMTVFTFDGSTWQSFDDVGYTGVFEEPICHGVASHTNAASADLGGTNVPAAMGFERVRVAVGATQAGTQVAIAVDGQAL